MPESEEALLRRAATTLRELADEATPGPWLDVGGRGRVSTMNDPVMLGIDVAVLRGNSYADAAWAAALGPQLAEPLAAWLELEADWARSTSPGPQHSSHSVDVARVLLGEPALTAPEGDDREKEK